MTIICPAKVQDVYRARTKTHYTIPLYSCAVAAGFPSPADEYLEGKLDLNQYLIPHPLATYLGARTCGELNAFVLRLKPTRGRTALSGYRENPC